MGSKSGGGDGGGGAYWMYVGAEGKKQQHRHAGKCRVHSLNPIRNSHHPKSDRAWLGRHFSNGERREVCGRQKEMGATQDNDRWSSPSPNQRLSHGSQGPVLSSLHLVRMKMLAESDNTAKSILTCMTLLEKEPCPTVGHSWLVP